MSNGTMEAEDKELAELKEQIEQVAEANKDQAESTTPSPEPIVSQATEAKEEPTEPATQTEVPTPSKTVQDDPMEWAKKKGFKSPEDMARALLQKEQEFHQSRQKAAQQPPQAPQWQPSPDWNGYQQSPPAYIPPPMPRPDAYRDVAAMYPDLPPEDVRRLMPLIVDAAESIANRKMQSIQGNLFEMQRTQARNNELMTLMQDPAFRDNRVQKEVHQILDSDPTIFQRERTPLAYAYEKAMVNLARKQLQQESGEGTTTAKPPVTAGGGNGSAFTVPQKITERDFDSWSDKEQKAFIQSNGRIIPKR